MTATTDTELFSKQHWLRLKEDLDLPPRQAEVLRCVLCGMADKQIARTTGISVNSVRSHLRHLFRKFDSNDRVELILHMFGYLRQYHGQEDRAPAYVAASGPAWKPRGQLVPPK